MERPVKITKKNTRFYSLDELSDVDKNTYNILVSRANGGGKKLIIKLFIPFIVKTKYLFQLDTDLYFPRNPVSLWNTFSNFYKNQALGIADNHDGMVGVNSGVILYDIHKLKKTEYKKNLYELTNNLNVKLGWLADQYSMNYIFNKSRYSYIYKLPCSLNRQLSIHAVNNNDFESIWGKCNRCDIAHFSSSYMKQAHAFFLNEGCSNNYSYKDKNIMFMVKYVKHNCCASN